METVAFYSYKGGVGRSLLLANAARFLATLGKGVVALDFDFEAPGLHYKLGGPQSSKQLSQLGGAVPYLIATAEGSASSPLLEEHTLSVPVPPDAGGWLRLMPAGPAPRQKYWAALKELGERLRLTDPSGQGFMALLDLKARIADELKPDYLLIDARTGVTELGGLATTILADTVVCMFAGNQESLDGTLTVVEALKAAPRLKDQKPIQVVPVLSRAAKPPEDEQFASGVSRLLELSERKTALFVLPHDDVFGVAERVVGGERKASAFSPLYKAYLELFPTLFPSRAEPAQHVLDRLKVVSDIRNELTSNRRERYELDQIASWSASAIQEGVIYKSEPHSAKEIRYADLLCLSEAGQPLMAVEYVVDGNEEAALEFWSKRTKLRCVVLLVKGQYSRERQVFTRDSGGRDLRRAERWDLPRPREFELLRDVGNRSVESMLDALRHGHIEAVAWLVNEWQESSLGSSEMRRGPRRRPWRPERAQGILDGLATTEDMDCAEEILRRASPGGDYRRHRERRFRDDFDFGENVEQKMAEDLFAPLFWRLPVEAMIQAMEPRRYPGEMLPLAGYQLLAEELMGLRYDPDRSALEEASAMAARDDGDDERALRQIHRSRRKQVRLSEEAPPALIWEEALRKDAYWDGTLEEARAKFGEEVRELMGSNVALRSRLKAAAARRELTTQGLLGSYDGSGRISLFPAVIKAAAEVLGLSSRYLTSIVFIHLSAWSLAHEARDLDGQRGYGFAPSMQTSPFDRESPAHVAIAQAFAERLIRRLKDPNLNAAFEKLSKHQTEPYTRWSVMRKLPQEKLRMLLLAARASPPALGLPEAGDGG